MSNFGWIFLLYIVIGWFIDSALTLVLFIVGYAKDKKKGSGTDCVDAINDNLDDALSTAESITPDNPIVGKIILIALAKIFWPISIPIGIAKILQDMK